MRRQSYRKRILALIMALVLVLQPILTPETKGFASSTWDALNAELKDSDRFHLEVYRDEQGHAAVTKSAITWKIIYNAGEVQRGEQSLTLALSKGQELQHHDSAGALDFNSQPKSIVVSGDPVDYVVKDSQLEKRYSIADGNVNNSEIVTFTKNTESTVQNSTYTIVFGATDKAQEIVFTTLLQDTANNEYYAYLGNDTEAGADYFRTAALVTITEPVQEAVESGATEPAAATETTDSAIVEKRTTKALRIEKQPVADKLEPTYTEPEPTTPDPEVSTDSINETLTPARSTNATDAMTFVPMASPTSTMPLTSTAQTIGGGSSGSFSWNATGQFDGSGNIIWTITASKAKTGLTKYKPYIVIKEIGTGVDILNGSAETYKNGILYQTYNPVSTAQNNYPGEKKFYSDVFTYNADEFKLVLKTPISNGALGAYTINVNPYFSKEIGNTIYQNFYWNTLTLTKPVATESAITVNLKDGSNAALAGYNFTLTNTTKNTTTTRTTDANGQIIFSQLPLGDTYSVKQTTFPSDPITGEYAHDPLDPRTVSNLTESGAVLDFINTKKAVVNANITVNLTDNTPTTPEAIAGAWFVLKNTSDNIVQGPLQTAIVGNTSSVTFTDVKPGDYTVEQTVFPIGYENSGQNPQSISLDGSGTAQTLQFTNRKVIFSSGTITVYAKDQTGNPLTQIYDEHGVLKTIQFQLQKKGTNGSYTNYAGPTSVDETGKVAFGNLPQGDYRVLTMLEGGATTARDYILPGPQDIALNPLAPTLIQVTPFLDKNGTGTIMIYSKESLEGEHTNTPIKGIQYLLVDDLGNRYLSLETDAADYTAFTNLKTDRKYTLYQSKLPYEYSSPTPQFEFKINEFAAPQFTNVVDVWNDKKTTRSFELFAHENGDYIKPISDAVFKIVREDGLEQTVTAGTDGKIVVDLLRISKYAITQIASDATHKPYENTISLDTTSPITSLLFPNKLLDPTSVKKDIVVNKVYAETAPSPKPDIIVDLYADGALKSTMTIPSASTAQSITFQGVEVYNANSDKIYYTVKERTVEGYYPVYTSTPTGWTITNHKTGTVAPGGICEPVLPAAGSTYRVIDSGRLGSYGTPYAPGGHFIFESPNGVIDLGLCAHKGLTAFWSYFPSGYKLFTEEQMLGKFKYGAQAKILDQAKLEEIRQVMAYGYEYWSSKFDTIAGNVDEWNIATGVSTALYDKLEYTNDQYKLYIDKYADQLTRDTYYDAKAYVPDYNRYDYNLYFLAISDGAGSFNQSASQIIISVQRCEKLAAIDIAGTKTWTGDIPSERPASIEVELYKNGMPTGNKQTVKPDANGNWSYIFKNLEKFTGVTANVYTVRETVVPAGYSAVYPDSTDQNNYNIVNVKASTTILKVDEAGNTITGSAAIFTLTQIDPLTGTNTNPLNQKTLTTDISTGLVSTGTLPVNTTWKLQETQSPTGYQLSDKLLYIKVNSDGKVLLSESLNGTALPESQTNPYKFVNKKSPGTIELTKTGTDSEPGTGLIGAKFQLYGENASTGAVDINNPIGEVQMTSVVGKITWSNLTAGNYYIKEVEAPPGYIAKGTYTVGSETQNYTSETYIKVTVTTTAGVTITLTNEKASKYPLDISKVDENNQLITPSDAAEGAEFKLYRASEYYETEADGSFKLDQITKKKIKIKNPTPVSIEVKPGIDTMTTGTAGQFKTDPVFVPGQYVLEETKNPKGYVGILVPVVIKLEEVGTTTKTGQWSVVDDEGTGSIAAVNNQSLGYYGINVTNRQLVFPSTGGIGTMIFTVAGLGLMTTAMLLRRKRKWSV